MRAKELDKLNKMGGLLCMGYRLREIYVNDIETNVDIEALTAAHGHGNKSTSTVVVRKKENGKYELIMGCLDYAIAVKSGQETVKALVGDLSREETFKEYIQSKNQLPSIIREV